MNVRGYFLLVGLSVQALVAAACTYEPPTASDAVGGQGGSWGETSSSSGPMGPIEDCLDGIDNDDDTAVDCADSDCNADFVCTEAVPDGWTRVLLELGQGEPLAEVPCENGDSPETLFTGPAGDAECEACACGTMQGTSCTPPGLICHLNSSGCNGTMQDMTGEVSAAECTKPDLQGAISISCYISEVSAVEKLGECPASIADFPNKYPWTGWVRACPIAKEGAGCTTGTCLPKPTEERRVCLRKTGQDVCPDGWNLVEAFASAKDERTCAECTCSPQAECVGGGYEFYDFDLCAAGGSPSVMILDGQCIDATNLPDLTTWSIKQLFPAVNGDCTAAGGEPMGSVVPLDPVTFCCQ